LLTVQLIGGVAAASLDYKSPFSEGKAVARFIKEEKLDDMMIAPEVRSDVSLEILGYLERDQFYYPRPRRFGSFVSWDPIYASTAYLPTEDVLQEIRRFCDETSEDVLIISGQVYPEAIRLKYDLKNLKVFRPSVIRESVQNFVLYRMTPHS
jgi:predicted metal-dependent phosphotriesterase family hydrolase